MNKNYFELLYRVALFFICPLLFASLSCSVPTKPPTDNGNIKKEYRWTETKLIQPQGKGVVPTAIWGSDTNDVWAVGWNDSHQGEIFHYDGNEWENVTPSIPLNDEYMDVFGFGKNDVYVAGDSYWLQPNNILLSSLILHYNGINWSVVLNDSTGQGYLWKIHGNSKNNIWAVGGNGSIYHFNGAEWKRKPFLDSLDIYSVYSLPTGQMYFINEYYNYPLTEGWAMLYFSEYFNDTWVNRDSCKLDIIKGEKTNYKFGYKAMWGVDNSKLISVGPWYWSYNSYAWKLNFSARYQLNDIKGNSWHDIYAVGDHGTIKYFNGSEWYGIGKYSSTIVDFKAVMPFEKIVYILGYYQGDTWIIKGEIIN